MDADQIRGEFERKVLPREFEQIERRRQEVLGEAGNAADPRVIRPVGLAFSGGGIRSATFNLGVLQGLADLDLLKYVDYLSTVSGGGYIGAWFHNLISRFERTPQNATQKATELLSPEQTPEPQPPQNDPIAFLRKYSNYLAPRPGLYSADTWTIGAIWLRNVLLNQLILIPALASVLMVPVFFVFLQQTPKQTFGDEGLINIVLMLLAFASLLLATLIASSNLDRVVQQQFGTKRSPIAFDALDRPGWIPSLIFFAALVLGCGNPGSAVERGLPYFWPQVPGVMLGLGLVLLFGVLQLEGGFVTCYEQLHRDTLKNARGRAISYALVMVPICAVVTGLAIMLIWRHMPQSPRLQITFAPPLMCGALLMGAGLLVGLMGADYPDSAREWTARIGASLGLIAAGWIGLFVMTLFGPQGFAWLLGRYGATAVTAAGAWIATTIGGVLAGRSAATSASSTGSKWSGALQWLIAIAPPAFMIGYLLLISFGVHAAFSRVEGLSGTSGPAAAVNEQYVMDVSSSGTPVYRVDVRRPTGWLDIRLQPARTYAANFATAYSRSGDVHPWHLLVLLAACVVVSAGASYRINVNEFSMHHFYKNRLVRCYLGAGNAAKRQPNPVTGFDPHDDFPLSKLTPDADYFGPYPIVNATLNINAGIELSQQERKSASFTFTPLYCGFQSDGSDADIKPEHPVDTYSGEGYRRTQGYSSPSGPAVGTVTAISGAAANPNSGYSTTGPMAFLLTVFDARLGWWLGNPRWDRASGKQGPDFALWYLMAELLGYTTARSRFVNLSDGGHFENLGLYELVRRRCRYIIVCDSEEDGALTFGSLGGAIRKCRADFGVEIDIDPTPIRRGSNGFSRAHCVMGTITYPELAPADERDETMVGNGTPATLAMRGWIFYLKSSLTGDEPNDVTEYHSSHPEFPHQSTADQFFSESQFESYRRLGLHIVRSAFEGVRSWQGARTAPPRVAPPVPPPQPGPGPADKRTTMFQELTQKWYAPIVVAPDAATRLADAYSELMRTLRDEENGLEELIPHLLPEYPKGAQLAAVAPTTKFVLFGTEVIQLIENVFTEYQLEHAANRANPRSDGWMKVFRRWLLPAGFISTVVWPRVQESYNPLFQQFIEQLQKEEGEDMPRHP